MNIKNCARCGKIYQYDGFKICHSCRKDDELDFQNVKEYLDENPGANISQVVDDTGVETKKLIEFLREGRLEIQGGGTIVLECENCSAPITTGRYCEKCTMDLQRELGQAMNPAKPKETRKPELDGKFRVIDRYDKRR